MSGADVERHLFVAFGGTGDLATRKLMPAIYHLNASGPLGGRCIYLAVGRREVDEAAFRKQALVDFDAAGLPAGDEAAAWCDDCLLYQPMGEGGADRYAALARRIEAIEGERGLPGNRVFYLALPPAALPGVVEGLGEAGLARGPGWTRLVVEKPFGRDLAGAAALNETIHTLSLIHI